jgi:REP element-mobilizing transposase RayT
MARPPRLQAPGTIHHLIARGNERREVFRDDLDREDYLERLARYRERFQFRLYAYCLMPNHVHLAVEQGPKPLSNFMHALQSSYTQRFNRRYERVGHLFQGRYKSFLVDCDRYFLALIKYIHENPVKAELVADARLYRWSSDRFFRSGACPPWLDLESAFALLGPSRSEAMRRYESLTSDRDPSAAAYEALVAREGAVKGDEDFAVAALEPVSLPRRSRLWTAERVARAVAACEGFSLQELSGLTRRRTVSQARLLAAYLGRERFGIPVSESARLFGREESGLAHGVRSLEDRLLREPELRSYVERIVQTAKLRA